MDTTWFAVDADGAVAAFESGESGAKPIGAHDLEELIEVLPKDELGAVCVARSASELVGQVTGTAIDRLLAEVRDRAGTPRWVEVSRPGLMALIGWKGTVEATLRGSGIDASDAEVVVRHEPPLEEAVLYDLVLRFSDDASVEQLVAAADPAWRPFLRFAGEPVTLYVSNASASTLLKLRSSGKLIAGGPVEWEPHLLGVYVYEHDGECEGWIAGPYLRSFVPTDPLDLDRMPLRARHMASRLRFDLRYHSTTKIQPAEHVECESWGREWMAMDGTQHHFDE